MVSKISSEFAILDVKAGRASLRKHFEPRPRLGPCPEELRIPVTITGYIGDVWSKDDGTSQEFEVQVDSVHLANIEAAIHNQAPARRDGEGQGPADQIYLGRARCCPRGRRP